MRKINIIAAFSLLCLLLQTAPAQWIKNPRFNGIYINCFAVYGGKIYTGTSSGVFLSADNGQSWDSVCTGLTNLEIKALATDGYNLFAGTWGDGIFLSTNDGASWTSASTNLNNYSIHTIAINGSTVFDGTENGICRSTDNGSTWFTATNGLTNGSVQIIVVKGTDIIAGISGGGIFRSTNDGIRWDSASTGLPVGGSVLALAHEGVNLYAAVFGEGVFISTNSQMTWNPVNSGLTDEYVTSLAVTGMNVFAGTSFGGVCLSTNNGSSWDTINTGLTDPNILSLAVSGGYVFAGTDNGLWRRSLSDIITGVENMSGSNPSKFTLDQNYPNPFNPATEITYSVAGTQNPVSLRVYDILGRQVATLVDGIVTAGRHTVSWNASKLSSGIYFCKMQSGINIQIRKMMLLK
jgi:ligand-binding sensor domain-containing protein